MLIIVSQNERPFSKAAKERIWQGFLKAGSTHSELACTLPYIMRRCEQEGISYVLTSLSKKGYHIKPLT